MTSPLLETAMSGLPLARRGKVRDLYDCGDRLLIIATDRISAFDHVLATGIPDKGRVLTQLSAFWCAATGGIVPNHLITTDLERLPRAVTPYLRALEGRSMLVRKTTPLPIECVARGYLSGSGWKDYQQTGAVCGIELPPGLRESDRLQTPLFTPATKATSGHDINISETDAAALVGAAVLARVKALTLALYEFGSAHAAARGIILADTKFEFGHTDRGELLLIDEVMTPDSSRYWPEASYCPGGAQESFDKQFVRDYLESIAWNKQPPAPALPPTVVTRTREKYLEAYQRLTDGAPVAHA